MSEPMGPSPEGNDQLRQEAAMWFARMRGPDAERHRRDFEQWLALGAFHRTTYNRIAEIWSLGRNLGAEVSDRRVDQPIRARSRSTFALAAVAILCLAVFGWGAARNGRHSPTRTVTNGQPLASGQTSFSAGIARLVRLEDASSLTLDAGTIVARAFDRKVRRLRLDQGRARIEVARDSRPFILDAGTGSITAANTKFEVRLSADRAVTVRLLDGTLAVAVPGTPRRRPSQFRLIRVGQTLTYGRDGAAPLVRQVNAPPEDWPNGRVEFIDVPVATVLRLANRSSSTKINVASPALAAIHISGIFRIDDPHALARKLSSLLDLDIYPTQRGLMLQSRPRGHRKKAAP